MIKQKSNGNFILIIFGPTGAGKTDLALQIAQQVEAEIVNMDVGQFYKPFSIGTAKPDWYNSPIPHHLFDIIDEPKGLTVVAYRDKLRATINTIWQNKKLPIVVGGSGFYLKSLFFPPRTIESSIEPVLNIAHNAKYSKAVGSNSWELLRTIDSVRAAQIDKNDTYRINRALTIWYATGRLPSAYAPIYKPLANCLLIFTERDKHDLYTNIDNRVIQMIDHGWIDEVKTLQGTNWVPFIRDKKIIGYDDICHYLTGNQTEQKRQHMIKTIQKRTRNYAKRQYTFWRMLEKKLKKVTSTNKKQEVVLESVNLTFVQLHLYIKQLLERLLLLGSK